MLAFSGNRLFLQVYSRLESRDSSGYIAISPNTKTVRPGGESFMSGKKKSPILALTAIVVGLAALPVAAFFDWVAGLIMLGLPVLMVYKAS